MSEQEVERHNRRELWLDAANHLRIAYESMETAQQALDNLGENNIADLLQLSADNLRAAADNAVEEAERLRPAKEQA